jgi:hypothetical protein
MLLPSTVSTVIGPRTGSAAGRMPGGFGSSASSVVVIVPSATA